MTLPAESQVGRRAVRPAPSGADGWLLTTGSGLPASYGEGPAPAGPSLVPAGLAAGAPPLGAGPSAVGSAGAQPLGRRPDAGAPRVA